MLIESFDIDNQLLKLIVHRYDKFKKIMFRFQNKNIVE